MAETSLHAHGHRHQARKLVHAAPWSIPTSEAAAKVKHSLVEVEHMFAVNAFALADKEPRGFKVVDVAELPQQPCAHRLGSRWCADAARYTTRTTRHT